MADRKEIASSPVFAGRGREMKSLNGMLDSSGFSILEARRGSGRTAMVRQLAADMNSHKVFYADLSDVVNSATFLVSLASQTLNVQESSQLKQLRELSNYFTYLRPVINYDRISGTQRMDFTLEENFKASFTLEQLLNWLARQSAKVLLILDDFQTVCYLRDDKFFNSIQEVQQQFPGLRIIATIAASGRYDDWKKKDGPVLLKEAPVLAMEVPDYEEFRQTLISWFKSAGRVLSESVADQLLEWTRGNASLTVKLSQQLLNSSAKLPDNWYLESMLSEYLLSQRAVFQTYRRLLTSNQWLLLRGIAKERGARQVMSGEFVRRHGLGSPSSVQTALDALYEKELVYEEDGRLYPEDVALSRWLEL